jgi:DNA polymerase sigma
MLGRRLPSFVERANAFCSSNTNTTTTTTREAKIATTEGEGEEDEDDESALDMISSRRSDDDDARVEDDKEEERRATRGEEEVRTRINEDFDKTNGGNDAFRATETTTLEEKKKKKNRARGVSSSSPLLEALTEELIASLRPSKQSEKRRRMVFRKMESLIRECFEKEFEGEGVNEKKNTIVVSAFGSVPFGTYLPDGDIDVCILGDHEVLDSQSWPERLSAFIARKEREEKKKRTMRMTTTKKMEMKKEKMKNATRTTTKEEEEDQEEGNQEEDQEEEEEEEYLLEVKDIVVIHADVRLLKCVVDGIVVDVSANQFGGLATLAFLKEVNAKIGKNDLFKRSVILVKAWAFYESRILGAPYALLSTYALKTLIICALRRFNKKESKSDATKTKKREIATPLDVLRIFFEYVSDFPWETHAVTIFGDVPVEKLDKVSVREFSSSSKSEKNKNKNNDDEREEKDDDEAEEDPLLDDTFVDTILKSYGPDSRPDANVLLNIGNGKKAPFRRRAIGAKHLHILDPLSETNNLGRSVSLGNFARVRAAFRLGAERLKRLEMESEPENITRGFEYFFKVALANRGGKLASCVGDDDEKFTGPPASPPQATNALHKRKPSLGSSSPFHSHSVADDLAVLKSPCKSKESPIGKEKISNEEDNEEKIRLMLDEEEKDAHGERGLFWGRWDGPATSSALPRALSSAEARVEISNARDKAKSSSSSDSMSPPGSDASSPVVSPPRSETGDSTTDSAEYSGDDTKSMMSLGSDSNATASSSGSMPPHSPLSPLDKYMSAAAFKTASIPPSIEESKDIITGCLETIHKHLNFGIEMQRLAIERQNAALNSAMMMNKRNNTSNNVVAQPPPLPSSPPRSSNVAFVPLMPSMPPPPLPPPPPHPPLPPHSVPQPITTVSAPSVVVPRSVVNVPAPQARTKTPSMNVRPKPNPIPQATTKTTTTTTKTIPTARVPSMNWKVACGNSNSSSAANTPTRNTTNAEPAAGSNVNVVSAKLMEHQSRDALEHERALKSSSDNSITTGRNGDQNASMVETVAWVHVARGGAARQARSSIDNGDLLSKKEQPSTPSPEEKKMKKTGKMWGAKEKKKAKAEEAAAAAAALVNDKLAHERDDIERELSKGHSSPARCKSVPLQPSWGPKGAVCLDTLRKVAEKKTTTTTSKKISPPGSVLSEDGAPPCVTFDDSEVQIALEAAQTSLKGVWAGDEQQQQQQDASSFSSSSARNRQKSKSANSSPSRNKAREKNKNIAPAPETSCEKSFPKFGNASKTTTIKQTPKSSPPRGASQTPTLRKTPTKTRKLRKLPRDAGLLSFNTNKTKKERRTRQKRRRSRRRNREKRFLYTIHPSIQYYYT